MIDHDSDPGSWARAIARGCVPSAREFVEKTPSDLQPDALRGEVKTVRDHEVGNAR